MIIVIQKYYTRSQTNKRGCSLVTTRAASTFDIIINWFELWFSFMKLVLPYVSIRACFMIQKTFLKVTKTQIHKSICCNIIHRTAFHRDRAKLYRLLLLYSSGNSWNVNGLSAVWNCLGRQIGFMCSVSVRWRQYASFTLFLAIHLCKHQCIGYHSPKQNNTRCNNLSRKQPIS